MSSIETLPRLLAHGRELDPERVGFLRDSKELLGDPVGLRERLDEDGYLLVRRFFDPSLILAARRAIFQTLQAEGTFDPHADLMDGIVVKPDHESFRPELVTHSPEVKRVVFGPELLGFYERLFGAAVAHFDFVWGRFQRKGHGTPPHCDWVYMGRGSTRLLTCWIPYVEIPAEVGGLLILENSHKERERIASYLSKDVDSYCSNDPAQVQKVAVEGKWSTPGWLSKRADSLPEKFNTRWLLLDHWSPGDFITFRMDLIHASLDNHTDRLRFSTDTRYQPAEDPLDNRWVGENPPGHGLAGKMGRIC